MTGAWTLTDEGEWILDAAFSKQLAEVKHVGSVAWRKAAFGYLSETTGYSIETLELELAKRSQEDGTPNDIMDEFIIEALEGNL